MLLEAIALGITQRASQRKDLPNLAKDDETGLPLSLKLATVQSWFRP
jgi:hypothetical protein